MDRCPNCRARYDGARECRRCGMELERLVQIETAAEGKLVDAVAAMVAGQGAKASAALRQAQALKSDPLGAALLRFIPVLDDDATGGRVSDARNLPVPVAVAPATESKWLRWWQCFVTGSRMR